MSNELEMGEIVHQVVPLEEMSNELDVSAHKVVPTTQDRKDLRFRNINYEVLAANDEGVVKEKTILAGVSGQVKGGNMMCVLGPSGSGKTSLIQIIASRIKTTSNKSHTVTGDITVDNMTLNGTDFRRISGLVTQEDVFNECLTVEETLHFAAELTLHASIRQERIEYVIAALHLESCRQTYIGDDANPYLKGISGGEKRRLAIALEILDPTISIIMLDEPTSGLDAAAAQNVANLLRGLADNGMAVLATLHQPRSTIMQRFDQVMVLAKGKQIYNGTLNDYTPYLVEELKIKLPELESPYDLLLDLLNPSISKDLNLTIGALNISKTNDNNADLLADFFESSDAARVLKAVSSSVKTTDKNTEESSSDEERSLWQRFATWTHLTKVLLIRTFLIKLRDPICLMTQVSSGIIMGLIFGALYYDTYNKATPTFAILDTQMCSVMGVMMACWLPYDVTLTFPKERKIFSRERKAGLYTTSSFYCARITADAPAMIVSSAIMAIIIHGMAGLKIAMGTYIFIMCYACLVGASLMQLIGAIARSFEEANIYMMVVMMMSMMLGSGFVRESPDWLEWARDISLMGISADLVIFKEFENIDTEKFSLTSKEMYSQFGVQIQNDDEFTAGILTLLYILLVVRVLTYLAVKFCFTGRTWEEDFRD